MKHLSSLIRFGVATGLVLALASACGGQSFTGDGGGGDGGSDAAGTNAGGKTNHGGTSSTAGKSHGGTSAGGNGTGGNGTAGTATAGAGGNGPGVYSCNVASDCMLGTNSCCGVCDGQNLTTQNFVAYNRHYAGLIGCGIVADTIAFGGATGIGAPPSGGTGNIACPPCVAPAPGQGTLKYFMADCVSGMCAVADVRTSNVSLCKTTADCKLRSGTSCCEGCGGIDDYVAVRNDGSLEKLVCSGELIGCPACLPQPPAYETPWCNPTTAHCEVVVSAAAGGG